MADSIGCYQLLETLGEGGYGVVYLAEQREPIRRRVALKVVKLGMDTRQVVGRFEAERQALALMDHPNIAKVLDAGATETGRPFFVMELVRGMKITDYCDQNNLSTKERLQLFIQVCHAIDHAHQKGIIHRDLKPSNILVTLQDGRRVTKIIDFGISKALACRKLAYTTVSTGFEQFVGTPAYMSPEQATSGGLDIDTRSDIYALGVLLYELLTGTMPFEARELLTSGFEGMRRIIREVEPPKPSTRLSSLHPEGQTSVAKHRGLQPVRLVRVLRGDLDWVVMKCLEKDRNRRYETAANLAADIQFYLSDQPVSARAPRALYRLQKCVRRNRLAFSAAGALLLTLACGMVANFSAASRAHGWQLRAESAQLQSKEMLALLKDALNGGDATLVHRDDTASIRDMLDRMSKHLDLGLVTQAELEAELRAALGRAYQEINETSKAKAMHRRALHLRLSAFGNRNAKVAESLNDLGSVLRQQGKLAAAEDLFRQASAMQRELAGKGAPP